MLITVYLSKIYIKSRIFTNPITTKIKFANDNHNDNNRNNNNNNNNMKHKGNSNTNHS